MKFAHLEFLLVCSLLGVTRGEEGDHAFEWAGIFETPEENYMRLVGMDFVWNVFQSNPLQ